MWMFWIENGERGYRCKQCERFVPLEDFLVNNKGPCECYKARLQVREGSEDSERMSQERTQSSDDEV